MIKIMTKIMALLIKIMKLLIKFNLKMDQYRMIKVIKCMINLKNKKSYMICLTRIYTIYKKTINNLNKILVS